MTPAERIAAGFALPPQVLQLVCPRLRAVTVDATRGITSVERGDELPVVYEFEDASTAEVWMPRHEAIAEAIAFAEASS